MVLVDGRSLEVMTASDDMIEDGCTCDRTLPALCVSVEDDGAWPAMEDEFAVCEGDPLCGDQ